MTSVKIESTSKFNQIIKKCLIRELYQKRKITQSQFNRLMQRQRSH